MPGGREITGRDVHAALREFGGGAGDAAALRAAVSPWSTFGSLDELARACPPASIGLTSGAYAAIFSPLFGEFE